MDDTDDQRDLRDLPELLAAFRADDEAARTKVYLMYVKRIEAWIRRGFPLGSGKRVPGLRNDDDHAEAVQEVFMRANEDDARLGYDGSVDYWTYLCAIARNVVSDFYRRRRRRPETLAAGRESDPFDLIAWAAVPEADEPAHGYLEQKARAIVREYIAGLQDPLRSVFHATYVERMIQADTAVLLDLSRDQVYRLIERLKREARALLEQAGIRDSNVTPDDEADAGGSAHG